LWIRDLDSRTQICLPDKNIKWSLAWLDDRHLVYLLGDHADRPFQINIHTLGTSFEEDHTVWTETDERFHLSVERARNGRAIICRSESKSSSEIRLLELNEHPTLRTIHPRQANHKYDASLSDRSIFIRSNHEYTEYALYELTQTGLQILYVPDSREYSVTIEDVDVMSKHLICWTRRNGIQELVVLDHSGTLLRTLQFPDPCYEIYPDVNVLPNTHLFRLRYSSLSSPDRVLEYDLNSGTHRTIKVFEIPGVQPETLQCERHWAPSSDGTLIPISLVKHVNTPNNAPCVLHGYGAYGVSYSPGFYEDWIPLLNRGWVMAIAHVRGGGELGRQWYEQGKLQNKHHSFIDLIACTEYLKNQHISDHVVISGGSAGGLLVAATLNLRPELFAGCVAEVPFVDVTNTMLDPDLPLTVIEYEEWGNPNHLEDFQMIQSYDPYEQYTGQTYPPVFVTAGLWDPRVGFWEPAKWIAKIRHHLPDSSHILLSIDLDSGHSGSSGRLKIIQENATKYAFILNTLLE
jgi:oligopeptidase B